MKKILLFATLLTAFSGFGQNRKSPHDTVSTKDVTVTYGRPFKHDRVIFGELVKYGEVWRLGADEATTISLNRDSKIGTVDVPAGTYTMFALVNENEWTIILNSVLGQWGAFSYKKNKDKDVAMVPVAANKLSAPVEQFTIRFDDDNFMIIEWELVQVKVQVKPNVQ
ncbi:MAG: DUF2911 domain-containing protein [Chitinophagaceae bacterium]|nr:DUF2911 domain-containing protein [Chitinophagaceae bacterium]MBK9660941.1 DUF2911 domain-containing protein [Chitinophagaceae bacterium]